MRADGRNQPLLLPNTKSALNTGPFEHSIWLRIQTAIQMQKVIEICSFENYTCPLGWWISMEIKMATEKHVPCYAANFYLHKIFFFNCEFPQILKRAFLAFLMIFCRKLKKNLDQCSLAEWNSNDSEMSSVNWRPDWQVTNDDSVVFLFFIKHSLSIRNRDHISTLFI